MIFNLYVYIFRGTKTKNRATKAKASEQIVDETPNPLPETDMQLTSAINTPKAKSTPKKYVLFSIFLN